MNEPAVLGTAEKDGSGIGDPESFALALSGKPAEQRPSFLAAHPAFTGAEVLSVLGEKIRAAFRTDVRRALALADACLFLAEQLSNDSELALACRAKANALSLMGQCTDALTLFERAITLFQQTGQTEEEGRTLSTAIRSHLLLGNYDNAFQAAERARVIFKKLGDTLRLARLEINVANIYHRQNRFREALDAYERASQQLLTHNDVEGVAVALHNVAVCRIALDDFRGALDAYRRLRGLSELKSMPLLAAQADYNSAFLYFLRGEYTQALKLLRSTRQIYRQNDDAYHLGLCDLDESEIYIELGLSDEAFEMAGRSCDRFQELHMGFELGRSLANRAIALGQQFRYPEALEVFKKSRQVFEAEQNQAWPSLIDLYRSLMLFEQGGGEEAGALCRQALENIRRAAMPSKEVQALLLLSRVSLRNGNREEAAQICQSAFEQLNSLELPAILFKAWLLRGEIDEASGNWKAAFECYQLCRNVLETMHSGLYADELKIGLMTNRAEVYEHLARLCLLRRQEPSTTDVEEAFGYIEAGRSRSLRDLLLQRCESTAMEESLEKQPGNSHAEDLRKELNWIYRRIEREELSKEPANPEILDSLRSDARLRERQLLQVSREQVAAGGRTDSRRLSRIASLPDICGSLEPGHSLLEYFSIAGDLWCAAISRQGLEVRRLASLAQIYRRLRLLEFQMNTVRLGPQHRERFGHQLRKSVDAHLRALYEDLIAPVRNLLDGDHLVIVASGALHTLPFHALLDGGRYLIEDFSVSYAPSASLYALTRGEAEAPKSRSLVIGVESDTAPHVRYEAERVAAAIGAAELLLGQDATEANLRTIGAESRIIHIATHGHFRQDNPMFSSIRLADSYLSLYDLYRMSLPAELLTLSGCVTGLGVVKEGDELVGLSRGLLFAGARSLLLSLWDVDDQTTADLMGFFYEALREEPRKSRALQSAMLQVLALHPHPYHWAPFKLTCTAGNQ